MAAYVRQQRKTRLADPNVRVAEAAKAARWIQSEKGLAYVAAKKAERRRNREETAPHRAKLALQKKRAGFARWRRCHLDEQRERIRAWCKKNRGRVREYKAARKAIKRGNSIEERAAVTAFYQMVHDVSRIRCHICGELVPRDKRQVDHVIPLARGGRHVVNNLACACASCNASKGARLPHEIGLLL